MQPAGQPGKPGKPAARSLHGCWTCRVRRKKCDEGRPVCTPCASLELECHGYGARPAWMDNGALQKEKALRFKQIVGQSRSKKSRQGAQAVFIAQSPHDAPGSTQADAAAKMMSLHGGGAMQSADLYFHQMQTQHSGPTAVIEPDGWITAPPSDVPAELPSPFFGGTNDYSPNSTDLYRSTDSGSGDMSPALFVDSGLPDPTNMVDFTEMDISWGEILSDFDDLHGTAFRKKFSSTENALAGMELQQPLGQGDRPVTPNRYAPPVTSAASTTLATWPHSAKEEPDEEAEDVIFMHFLDQVFYLQYPYYQSRDGRERGWLFSVLRRVKPAYYATLAQSERHFLATVPHNKGIANSLAQRQTGTTYYDLAIQGMRCIMAGVSSNISLVHSIEALTSLLQLLFLEGFIGGTDNWQDLLRAAAKLVPSLVSARRAPATLKPGESGCGIEQYRDSGLSPELRRSCCVMLGSFISFDIIAAASTRGDSLLGVDHLKELENLGTPVQSMLGCRNTVLALICEVTVLDRWKKTAQAAHKLSIVDLARRGAKIEERLWQEAGGPRGSRSPGSASPWEPSSEPPAPPTHPEVNRVYALAGIIYLHVVMSGAHPYLQEIRQAVTAVLEALKELRGSEMVQSLSWPICVAGCLATEDQYASFRQLFSATAAWDATNGTCSAAYRIIQACWEKRKNSEEDCDWASIMAQEGRFVLLR